MKPAGRDYREIFSSVTELPSKDLNDRIDREAYLRYCERFREVIRGGKPMNFDEWSAYVTGEHPRKYK